MTDLLDLFRILWRRKGIIILTVIASLSIVIAGLFLIPPSYSAVALVRISTVPNSPSARADLGYADRIMNTYAVIMTSRPVLDTIINDLGLEISRDALKGNIRAQAIEDTELMSVSATASQPELAASIANTAVDALINGLSSAPQPTSSTILAQIEQIQQELADLRTEYNRILVNSPEQTQRITELSRSTTVKQQSFEQLLDQYDQARLSESLSQNSITLVEPAVPPVLPILANKALLIGLAAVLGLAGGIGLSLLFQNINRTVYSPTQLQTVLPLPIIGMVPNLSRPKDISYKDDIRTEAFRQLRTDLLALDPESKVIAVSSANESEGKSTIVANLALSLARLNRKILIIDFDLRSPTQDKLFNLPNDVGISTVLMNKSQLNASIQPTKSPFLKIMTSGPVTPHSTELLFMTSARAAKLLETLQRDYDYILLDTPPLLPVADTAIIAQLVDSVIQVVRSGHSGELTAMAAQQRISQLQARQVGIVLNNVAANGKLYHYDVIPAKANT